MTIDQLTNLNEQFQQKATELAELLPGSNLLTFSSGMIRSAQKLHKILKNILSERSPANFYAQMDALEEEMDELIYVLDKMDVHTRKERMELVMDTIKRGYELLSLYSICADHILERKAKKLDEFE